MGELDALGLGILTLSSMNGKKFRDVIHLPLGFHVMDVCIPFP